MKRVAIRYLRMMKADIDGLPLIDRGKRDCLAVRSEESNKIQENQIIDVELTTDGKFVHLAQGLSLTIPPKSNIPEQLFKPKRNLTCYEIEGAALEQNLHLEIIEDSATHAMIVPKYDMHIAEYHLHLEATRHLWGKDNG